MRIFVDDREPYACWCCFLEHRGCVITRGTLFVGQVETWLWKAALVGWWEGHWTRTPERPDALAHLTHRAAQSVPCAPCLWITRSCSHVANRSGEDRHHKSDQAVSMVIWDNSQCHKDDKTGQWEKVWGRRGACLQGDPGSFMRASLSRDQEQEETGYMTIQGEY